MIPDTALAVLTLLGVALGASGCDLPDAKNDRRVVVIAHRGNSTVAPENTLASVESAFEVGADMVEIDVHLTRDRVPIVIHDGSVDRTTDGRGLVAEMTLSEIKKLDAGAWRGAEFTGERVPTLREVVRITPSGAMLLLDVKVDGAEHEIAEAVRSEGFPFSRLAIGTWTSAQRDAFAAVMPDSYLLHSQPMPRNWNEAYLAEQRIRGVSVIESPDWSTELIRAVHRNSMDIWVYTVNDPGVMRRLVRAGVDGLETDFPKKALHARRY